MAEIDTLKPDWMEQIPSPRGYNFLKDSDMKSHIPGGVEKAFSELPRDVQTNLNKLDQKWNSYSFWRFIDNAIFLHNAVEKCEMRRVAFGMGQAGRYFEIGSHRPKTDSEEQKVNSDLYHALHQMVEEGLEKCSCVRK